MVLLLFLRDALMVILCFFFGIPAVNYAFPMVFLWFLCSSFLQFSIKIFRKISILGCLEPHFGSFLVSWGLVGFQVVPKVLWRGRA